MTIFSARTLTLIRMVQGIVIGGEFAGNLVFLCESTKKQKYLVGSIGSCTGSFGFILASIFSTILYKYFNQNFVYQHGWRIAFIATVPLGLAAFIFRLRISESKEFKLSIKSNNPFTHAMKQHKKTLLCCIGLTSLHAISFYFVFIYIPLFLNNIRHLPIQAAIAKNMWFLVIHMTFIPIFAYFVNFVDGLRLYILVAITFFVLAIPLTFFIIEGSNNQIVASLLIFSVLTAFNSAIIPGLLTELTPVNTRYTIVALSFNIAFGVLGGITPFLSLFLVRSTRNLFSPTLYLMSAAVLTIYIGRYLLNLRNEHEIRKISCSKKCLFKE